MDRQLLVDEVKVAGDIANHIDTETKHGIIAASPLFKQPGTVPFRVVIIHTEGQDGQGVFVVYDERFIDYHKDLKGRATTSLSNGSYHVYARDEEYYNQARAFAAALAAFALRVTFLAEYAKSLNRHECLTSVDWDAVVAAMPWDRVRSYQAIEP